MPNTKGFITIATGDKHYYENALELLRSYRYFSKSPMPFAILCDRGNEYTAEFDCVKILKNPGFSYLDKLGMFEHLPYGVNIFIDADCLAYGDLNSLFDIFRNADDFSCFGRVLPLDDKTGWFEYDNLGELKSRVDYVVGLHGGIYYMRKTPLCEKILSDAIELTENYKAFGFKGNFSSPGDEPLIALSMAVNKCRPIPHDETAITCFWEHENKMRLNMARGEAYLKDKGIYTNLVHWGTRFTRARLYKNQTAQLAALISGNRPKCFALKAENDCVTAVCRGASLCRRTAGKAARMCGLKRN
jgi:hypothetical protein